MTSPPLRQSRTVNRIRDLEEARKGPKTESLPLFGAPITLCTGNVRP